MRSKEPIVISERLMRQRQMARRVEARYDAAQTSVENRRHWAYSDGLSVNAAHSPGVLKILRNRSRYEVANNSYASGLVETIADYVVGTGPRLQVLTDDDVVNTIIEDFWTEWSEETGFDEKLHTMRMSKCESGEVFGIFTENPELLVDVKLDMKVVEADQIMSPTIAFDFSKEQIDGIKYDAYNNPKTYTMMNRHPGDMAYLPQKWKNVPAQYVAHLFTPKRPGQARGAPELTPALALFAYLRRYTLATINAAEQAALITGMIYTDAPPNADDVDAVQSNDPVTIDRGTFLTLPQGWKAGQMKAEQPTTMYTDFKNSILNEIARCVKVPFNIVAGNSSSYNYASGRLDHQAFTRSIKKSRSELRRRVLEKAFSLWFYEAVRIYPDLRKFKNAKPPKHQWFWDGFEHVDPAKEASAQETRLANNTTTLADEYAEQGYDWRVKLKQRGDEIALMKEYGIPVNDPVGIQREKADIMNKAAQDKADEA